MWLPDGKRAAVLAGAFLLAGCGFSPALQTDSPAAGLAGHFAIEVAGGREEYLLEEALTRRLGLAENAPPYRLEVTLEISRARRGLAGAGGVDRFALDATAGYRIWEAGSGGELAGGEVSGSASFSSNADIVASLAAERDAEMRLAEQLADRILSRLILTAEAWLP